MKKFKLVLLNTILCIGAMLFGCSEKSKETETHDDSPYTLAEIKAELEENPQSAVSMIVHNMNGLSSVHIERHYDDRIGSSGTMDLQKENDVFIALEVESESEILPATCSASDLPDFGVAKGWDWREYCASVYGADFRSEPETIINNDYSFYNNEGIRYYSSDGVSYKKASSDTNVTLDFDYLLGIDGAQVKNHIVSDNEDGGITVEIERDSGSDITIILNKNGYVVTTKESGGNFPHDSETMDSFYSDFNETSFDYSGFHLEE